MSSPICARRIFLSAPARTTARAPSPSITTPKRTRFGGGGGGAGGSTACTIGGGAGGGAGGRRLGENNGRSSIVDSWSRDCAATGLEGAAADGSCACAATPCTVNEQSTRMKNAAGHRVSLMASLVAKTRASSKWSAIEDLRRRGPPRRRPAAPSARPRIHTAFRFRADTEALAVPSNSYQAWPEGGSYQVRRRAWQLLLPMKPGWRADRRPIAPDMTATVRSRGLGSKHRGMRRVAPLRLAGLKLSATWLRGARVSRAVRKLPAWHQRVPEATAPAH